MKRFLKRLLIVVLLLGGIVAPLAYWGMTSSWFLCKAVLPLVSHWTHSDIRAESMQLSLFTKDAEISGLRITLSETPLLTAKRAYASFSLKGLLMGQLNLSDVRLDTPHVSVVQSADGTWNFDRSVPEIGIATPTKRSLLPATLPFELWAASMRNGTVELKSRRGDELRFDNIGFSYTHGKSPDFAGAVKSKVSYRNPFGTAFVRQPLTLQFAGTLDTAHAFPATLEASLVVDPLKGTAAGRLLDSQTVRAQLNIRAVDSGFHLEQFRFDIARAGQAAPLSRFSVDGLFSSVPDTHTSIRLHAERLSPDALHFLSGFLLPEARWDNTELVYDGALTISDKGRCTLAGSLSAYDIMFRPTGDRPIFPQPSQSEITHHLIWEYGKTGILAKFNAQLSNAGKPLFAAQAERHVGLRFWEAPEGGKRLTFYRPESGAPQNPEIHFRLQGMPLELLQPWLTADTEAQLFDGGVIDGTFIGNVGEKSVRLTGKGELRDLRTHRSRLHHQPLDLSLRVDGEMQENNDLTLNCYALSLTSTGNPIADMEFSCSYIADHSRFAGAYGVNTYPLQLRTLVPPLAANPLFGSWISKPLLENSTLSLKGTFAVEKQHLRAIATRALLVSGQTFLAHGDIEIFPGGDEPRRQPFTADIALSPQFLYALVPPSGGADSEIYANIRDYIESHEIRLGASGAYTFSDSGLVFNAADLVLQPLDSALALFPTKISLKNPIRISPDAPLPQIDFAVSGYDHAQYIINFLSDDEVIKSKVKAAAGRNAMVRWAANGSFAKDMLDFSLTDGTAELHQDGKRTINIILGEPLVIPISERRFPAVLSLLVEGTLPADSGYVFIPAPTRLMPSKGSLYVDGALEYRLEEAYLSIRAKGHIDGVTLAPSTEAYSADLSTDLGLRFRERSITFRKNDVKLRPLNDSTPTAHVYMSPSQIHWRNYTQSTPLTFNCVTDTDFLLRRFSDAFDLSLPAFSDLHSNVAVVLKFDTDSTHSVTVMANADTIRRPSAAPLRIRLNQTFFFESGRVRLADGQYLISDSQMVPLLDLRPGGELARPLHAGRSPLSLGIESADLPRLFDFISHDPSEKTGLFLDVTRDIGLAHEPAAVRADSVDITLNFTARDLRVTNDERRYSASGKFHFLTDRWTLDDLLISDGHGTARGMAGLNPTADGGFPFYASLDATAFKLRWNPNESDSRDGGFAMADNLQFYVRGKGFSADNLKAHGEGILTASLTRIEMPFYTKNVWIRLCTLPITLAFSLNPVDELQHLFVGRPRGLKFQNAAACVTLRNGHINIEKARFRNGNPASELIVLGKIDPVGAKLVKLNAAVMLNPLTIVSFAADGTLADPKYNPLSSAGRTVVDNVGNVVNLPDLFDRINPFATNGEKPLSNDQLKLIETLRFPPPDLAPRK